MFDCLDDKDNKKYVDGFSDREEVKKSLVVPDYLFFGEEVGRNIDLSEWYGDKKKKRVSARGIIDILKRYNFTVEENTPFDQEVSLDPELLGKVFENLLASYNPETQSTARKQTGSFYTPRDIVQYMVDESLVAHLKRMVGEELEAEYRKLISYVDEENLLTDTQKQQVMEAIYHCKILDPACGSGAFPVGMLQQMVHILSKLDPTNEQWKKMMLDKAVNESRTAFQAESREEREERLKDIENSFDENLNNPDYARKLYLIENCIYGVDIQPIAIQISKLRFFISLVVDQKTTADPSNNFGIRPLPNLEAKFVAANSLIPLAKTENNLGRTPEIIAVENKLKEANHKIFGAKTVHTKCKWKERLIELRAKMAEKLTDNGFLTTGAANQLASWDMFNQNTSASFFDAEWMFGVQDGFDVVIGNPPYGASINNDQKDFLKQKYYYIVERIRNSYLYFMGLADIAAPYGAICYIVPNEFLFQIYMSKARSYFLSKTRILKVLNIGESAFDAVVPTCIFILDHHKVDEYDIQLVDFRNTTILKSSVLANISFVKVKNKRIINTPLSTFSFNQERNELLGKLLKSDYRLENFCSNIFNGISTSCNDVYIVSPIQAQSYKLEENYLKPTIKGEHIHKYSLPQKPPLFILYIESDFAIERAVNVANYLEKNKELLISKCVEKRKGIRSWFELFRSRSEDDFKKHPKIIIRQTGDSVIAAIDNLGYYSIDSTNVIVLKPQFYNIINFLLAILNSKLMKFYYQEISQENGRVLAQVKPIRIKGMPIPKVLNNDQNQIISLVERILAIKCLNPTTDTSKEEQEIDKIIYRIYALTYDEVRIVDSETPITREEYEKGE